MIALGLAAQVFAVVRTVVRTLLRGRVDAIGKG
jgi:hypothetical protein